MSDLNRVAKRMYNIHPNAMYLVVDEELQGRFTLQSAEFFQTEFQAEGTREGDDALYRFATTEDNEAVIVGRQAPGEDGWSMVGDVESVERLDE
ncbi:transcriptional regulator [Haloferax sp. MBLA0076]|uniref:Transcriptional regulator n=1 Tax=Haloferax litoreum TaxID=2666140 RepID=A0A6A8GFW3_9EURY|nr:MULTISPECIES: transcriptional regulator [Haloferax]KAB1193533.1 transcriptional regulator [Haloferax sp. CBA1148]MRX22048.1 transcriptional regulator [Haloferax litoreum]